MGRRRRRSGIDVGSTSDPELRTAMEFSQGKGPDVVVDTVGDFELARAAMGVLAARGRMAVIAAPREGNTVLGVDVLSLYRRQVELVGVNSAGETQEAMTALLGTLGEGFERGTLRAAEEGTMNLVPIERAAEAYREEIKRAVIVFD